VTGAFVPTGSAAILNLTVTNTGTAGYLTVYPADQPQPGASNLNFAQGETIANLAAVQLSAAGAVKIYSSAPVDVIVDAAGSFGRRRADRGLLGDCNDGRRTDRVRRPKGVEAKEATST